MTMPPAVLITGTTSGIGRALLQHYQRKSTQLIAVNRRHISDELHNNVNACVLDITNQQDVCLLFDDLVENCTMPDVFILNAGINKIDNFPVLDYSVFKEVMNINLMGALTFVGEIQRRGLRNRTIFALSSCANIVPNPAYLGYYLSKLNLHRAFRLFKTSDPFNRYKTIILGPVHTNMTEKSKVVGFNKYIFDILVVSVDRATETIVGFINGSGTTLRYPRISVLVFYLGRLVLTFLPGLYSGSQMRDEDS